MVNPPPELYDLAAWNGMQSSSNQHSAKTMWKIGVPEKRSLIWSILLSFLFSSSDTSLTEDFRKLTGGDSEVQEIKKKKNMSIENVDFEIAKKELKRFNPFKNRHASFIQAKGLKDIFRIFKLRLNRYTSQSKNQSGSSNDDLKLNSAAQLLKCKIDVYFLKEEIGNRKVELYPKTSNNFERKIVLFQYEDKQHGSRTDSTNVFHFAMSMEQAHPRKLDALKHFLKKAGITDQDNVKINRFMKNSEDHGKKFLSTILKSESYYALSHLYKSPYIAFKLLEAGFETNPVQMMDAPSAFSYAALVSKDPKYFRILYDYASNCRCLFDLSVRRTNDKVLETLKQILEILKTERPKLLSSPEFQKDTIGTERTFFMLSQYIRITEFQIKITTDLRNLKLKQSWSEDKTQLFMLRKEVIIHILENYSNFFYCSLNGPQNLSTKFINFFHFSEYYENIDNFAYLSFFDNFYELRLLLGKQETQENKFLNIEWRMLLFILSNKYFPRDSQEVNLTYDKMQCQRNNVLRHVPLCYRNWLRADIEFLLKELKDAPSADVLSNSLKHSLQKFNTDDMLIITDELLLTSLDKQIQAALEVPLDSNGIKDILVIQRALQVLGESIKLPYLPGAVVPCLLRSCLTANLRDGLIKIRNDLSHYRDNSVHGILMLESKSQFFNRIKDELSSIKERIEIVRFTQSQRIQELLMTNVYSRVFQDLKVTEDFQREFDKQLERFKDYGKNHRKLEELLRECLSNLQEYINDTKQHKTLCHQLFAVKFLIEFMSKHIKIDDDLGKILQCVEELTTVENINTSSFDERKLKLLLASSSKLVPKNLAENTRFSAPAIESLYGSLKISMFSDDEQKRIALALKHAYKEGIEAEDKLKEMLTQSGCESEKVEELLKRCFLPIDTISQIKSLVVSNNEKKALHFFENVRFTEKTLESDLKIMLGDNSSVSGYTLLLLIKIAYQKYLPSNIYTSVVLTENILQKLQDFLTKKVRFLITRLRALKSILIDENEDIQTTWTWGRSKAIQFHMKFLMRQRYINDMTFRSSLEMAYFGCVNILKKDSFEELFIKSNNLFSSINLRNIVAHCCVMPETVGEILDKDDFPSEMIEKMLTLIDDSEAIEAILELLPKSGVLEEDNFKKWLENPETLKKYNKEVAVIKKCARWEKYLFLFPLIPEKKNT